MISMVTEKFPFVVCIMISNVALCFSWENFSTLNRDQHCTSKLKNYSAHWPQCTASFKFKTNLFGTKWPIINVSGAVVTMSGDGSWKRAGDWAPQLQCTWGKYPWTLFINGYDTRPRDCWKHYSQVWVPTLSTTQQEGDMWWMWLAEWLSDSKEIQMV